MTQGKGRPAPRLVGVYNADGGTVGEIKYIAGKLLGQAHCSLCDVTHSPVRRKKAWDAMVRTLPYQFVLLHRNELPANLQEIAATALPVVVLEDGRDVRVLLRDDQIASCEGDPERFAELLIATLAAM